MRLVITGTGVLSTVGIGADRAFEIMLAGGGGRVAADGCFAAIPAFDPKVFLGERGIRHFDRTALLLASAARLALDSSGLAREDYSGEETGVVVGSTHGSIEAIAEFDREALREGPKYVSPQAFSNTVINAPASRLSILHQATGLNTTLASGSASALDALAYGVSMLRAGRIAMLLCGAAIGRSREIAAGYRAAGKFSAEQQASPPFSPGRRGAAPAEGAAVFVIEDASRVQARGGTPLGVVSGAGSAFATDGDRHALALEGAVRDALREAEIAPAEISCIVSSASGSMEGDRIEGEAIGRLFGTESAAKVPVTAPKSMTGECLEASAAIAVAVSLSAIERGAIPPIASLEEVDPAFSGLDLVRGRPREVALRHALVLSRDDSGHCAAALISKP